MSLRRMRPCVIGLVAVAAACGVTRAGSPIGQLQANARDGQVFLTWNEAETPEGTTFNVYLADEPITDMALASRIAHHIERHGTGLVGRSGVLHQGLRRTGKPVGFRVANRRATLWTPQAVCLCIRSCKGLAGEAVLCGDMQRFPRQGKHQSHSGCQFAGEGRVGSDRRNQTDLASSPAGRLQPAAGKGKSLWLNVHALTNVVPDMEYLVFGDETLGWREGLPFKFSVRN